jgi:hypothetical protein
MAYFDKDGKQIGFLAAGKFQARHPKEYAEAQKQHGRGGLTIREFVHETGEARREEIRAKHVLTLTPAQQAEVAEGAWWASADAFKSLGVLKLLTLSGVSYYGGWPGHPSPEGKSNLVLRVNSNGIALRRFKDIFEIPWSDVADIAVEGPEQAANRFTATRLIALGPLGLAFKKDNKGSKEAIITVTTKAGDEAIFNVAKTLPREIAPKLTPVAMQARRAQGSRPVELVEQGGEAPDVLTQIKRLAELRDQEILSAGEFDAKKSELLTRL